MKIFTQHVKVLTGCFWAGRSICTVQVLAESVNCNPVLYKPQCYNPNNCSSPLRDTMRLSGCFSFPCSQGRKGFFSARFLIISKETVNSVGLGAYSRILITSTQSSCCNSQKVVLRILVRNLQQCFPEHFRSCLLCTLVDGHLLSVF